MKIDKYIATAMAFIVITAIAYVWNFFFKLEYPISENPMHWAMLGDYLGGVLNPVLSFITIILLIQSLNIQSSANNTLRQELETAEKSEKYRQFESLFFNLVESQRELFDGFRIITRKQSGKTESEYEEKSKAVIFIEDSIESLRKENKKDKEIEVFLEEVDRDDSIFGLIRAFYVTIKLIDEKITTANGFSLEDRKSHYITLINLTDFSQLRIILIGIQFLEYQSCKYIRENFEFMQTLAELGFKKNPY